LLANGEAMKMEEFLCAAKSGIVSTIYAN